MITKQFSYHFFRLQLLLIFFMLVTSSVFAGCLDSFNYYKLISIHSSQVIADMNDFPVLIEHIDNDLKHISQGGTVQNMGGLDIIFTAADSVTVLDHQIESYNPMTGKVTMWVRIPFLSASVDTDIIMYYGDNSITSGVSTTDVWDSNFESVYHFATNASMGDDSTSNGNNLANTNVTNFVGIADDGANIEYNDRLTGSPGGSDEILGDLTFSCWMFLHSLQPTSGDNLLFAYGDLSSNYAYSLSVDGDWRLRTTWEYGASFVQTSTSSIPIATSYGVWTQLSMTRDRSAKTLKFYQNGIQVGSDIGYTNNPTGAMASYLSIGQDQINNWLDFDGQLDELRISSSVRSADWLLTEYNSISSPSTFYSLSSQISVKPSFSYLDKDYCIGDPDPVPTFSPPGGIFSTSAGISVSAVTGEVDLSTSTLNSHIITYTVPSGCFQTDTIFFDSVSPEVYYCPVDINVASNSSCNYTLLNYTNPSNYGDNCTISVTQMPVAGSLLNTGITNVVLVAEDENGNSTNCDFNITVIDNSNPTISCPLDVSVNTDPGDCIASGVNLGLPTTGDNCGVMSVTNNAPTSFPLGVTNVIWTVTDNSGNTAVCTQVITVNDNKDPFASCHPSVSVNTDAGTCIATGVTLLTPTASDNCGVMSITNNAPTSFPLGSTNVTWTATDNSGNMGTCIQEVVVNDNLLPTISCANDTIIPTDLSLCDASGIVLNMPVTGDNCSVGSIVNDAPLAFSLGDTDVLWTVTDGSGNMKTCTQLVTIVDTIKPTISCANDTIIPTDLSLCDASGIVLNITVTGDNCSVGSIVNDAPLVFNLGDTDVLWTVTDGSGNMKTCTQWITIVDTINPTISCANDTIIPTDLFVCDVGSIVLNTPITNDNCSVLGVTNNAPSVFNLGDTDVIWTATDGSGNIKTCTQLITIIDTIKPTIVCANDTIVCADLTSCNASGIVLNSPITGDNCSVFNLNNTEPTLYPFGNTDVLWTVTDGSGNIETCIQTVTVVDTIVPILVCAMDTVVATDLSGCVATYNAQSEFSSSDNCLIDSSYFSTMSTVFNLGVNSLDYTAVDIYGNTATCTQLITVVDTIAPFINCIADTMICDSILGYSINYGDNCSVVAFSQIAGLDSGVIYPIGITTNIFEAIDQSGNRDTCYFNVTRFAKGNSGWLAPQDTLCLGGDAIDLELLVAGPVNGFFTGPGILGSQLNPSIAGVGQHSISYVTGDGTCTEDSAHIVEVVDAASFVSAGIDDSVCGLNYVFDSGNSMFSGVWSGSFNNEIFVDEFDINTTVEVQTYEAGDFVWTVLDPVNCNYSDTVSVTFFDQPESDAGEDIVIYQTLETNMSAILSQLGSGFWSTTDNVHIDEVPNFESLISVTDFGEYELIWNVDNDVCPIAEDIVEVSFRKLLLPEGISPNGDGFNDYLEIIGLDQFEDKRLTVFDRWGKLVFQNLDYDNQWNGVNVYGESLISDTYFYEIVLDDFMYKGFITLKR